MSRFALDGQKLRLTATVVLSKAQTVDYAPWFGLLFLLQLWEKSSELDFASAKLGLADER
jgi:hypothetical protein